MNRAAVSRNLPYWTVVCLRPASQQAAAARAIEARGARVVALPGIALEALDAGPALHRAVACRRVIFTSPAAVEFANVTNARIAVAIAVGSGTARALAERGIVARQPDATAMHSEGVLALPELAHGDDPVGLVTAPGGRGLIEPALRARGIGVKLAQVYRRVAPTWSRAQTDALRDSGTPRSVLVTSGDALTHALAHLAADLRATLLASTAVASSARLAQAARDAGFENTLVAASPAIDALLDTLAAHAKAEAFR